MKSSVLILILLCLFLPGPATAEKIFDMRGDGGVLMDFEPTGVQWLDDDRLFVVDKRWNAFHIFDTQGRRFRFIEFPKVKSPAFYAGVAELEKNEFFAIGTHYHRKNNPRYLRQRAVIHKILLDGEFLKEGSVEDNYSPDLALRKTRLFGQTPREQMEISGIAFDKKHNRVFFSLKMPLDEKGEAIIFTGPLDKFLERDESMELERIKTELKPPIEPACQTQTYVSDIEYVPGRGLVLLLTAEAEGGFRFCSNQIWFLPGGFGKAKMVKHELAPQNRATGISLKQVDKWNYKAALVCDNDPEETKIPSRLVLIDSIQLKLR